MPQTPSQTFYWYDLETFGTNPKTTRISQFAGVRTDLDLNIIGEPLVEYCQPTPDFLPELGACLVTGITPQHALNNGISERDLIAKIHAEFSTPNTCVLGFNSLRFDDEFIRYALYRNFYDPYAREWQNGCSRWDIIDIVRLTRALRPEGIEWPVNEDGTPTNRLELITQANGISHTSAHDAMSDVYATIEVAKLIKNKQPKLWDYCFNNRDKRKLAEQLNLSHPKPVVHASGMYGLARSSLAVVLPVAQHPTNNNGIIVYDLADDPSELIAASSEEIAERVFTATDDLPDGLTRFGLKTVHINKCPALAPINTLSAEAAQRLGIDVHQQLAHATQLMQAGSLNTTIQEAFSNQQFETLTDPDQNLYGGGFTSGADKQLMPNIVNASLEQLSGLTSLPFQDPRFNQLLFRYRARNNPQGLSEDERLQWHAHCMERVHDGAYGYQSLVEFEQTLEHYVQEYAHDENKLKLIRTVAEYVTQIA